MSDEPGLPLSGEPSSPEEYPAPLPEPERTPFWSWGDVLVVVGLAIPCNLLGFALVEALFWVLHFHPALATWSLVASQIAFYGLLFGVVRALFRLKYDRPFWHSLGWTPSGVSPLMVLSGGVALVFGLNLLGVAIRAPRVDNPMTELLKDPTSMVLMAIFGSVAAPVFEELLFRGFLQPLMSRTLRVAAGIAGTAVLFGMLHFREYGNSWRHVLLISISGVVFGWVRHSTGSTKAAAGMHACFNGFQFVMLLMAKHFVR